VSDAIEAARPKAESPELTLTARLPESLIAHVDPGRIRQVVDNLISNAIEYNDRGGETHV
jgi:two-component system phosphate regulon sensor histidine kinase PhoR